MNESIDLFSPLFKGSEAAWKWICDVSNGRWSEPPELTPEQKAYAERVGYLPLRRRA
ncbi:hypothetical protein Hden_0158 [Hyphomicrobium denitrificans ATCC 51888]|uniref:Uncharacterized protein n=1 Tax=Hyphomicrobium denitrificans (strain ATCC 51888 / DSM 1869 / NCIMB 11706 / TK 0415) TaxID=582899 RepID=D8JQ64_HYPDA|nr:hypothetical protein [Hyphomicrobium denitrificans]ADJ21985.1 hypothetical protein Hden_0158 [Hyphomicrobium denitrificans ATCC 51888]